MATSGVVHSHAARADGKTRRPRSARRSRRKCRMRITHRLSAHAPACRPELHGSSDPWVPAAPSPARLAPADRWIRVPRNARRALTAVSTDTPKLRLAAAYQDLLLRVLRVLRDLRVVAVGASRRDRGQSQSTWPRVSETIHDRPPGAKQIRWKLRVTLEEMTDTEYMRRALALTG